VSGPASSRTTSSLVFEGIARAWPFKNDFRKIIASLEYLAARRLPLSSWRSVWTMGLSTKNLCHGRFFLGRPRGRGWMSGINVAQCSCIVETIRHAVL
jgi:hypothetical protein